LEEELVEHGLVGLLVRLGCVAPRPHEVAVMMVEEVELSTLLRVVPH
jgi:hypothetical protein